MTSNILCAETIHSTTGTGSLCATSFSITTNPGSHLRQFDAVNVGQTAYAHNAAVNYMLVATPHLLNELTLAFNRNLQTEGPPASLNGKDLQDFGANINAFGNFPTMNLTISNWSGFSLGQTINSPQTTYQIADIAS